MPPSITQLKTAAFCLLLFCGSCKKQSEEFPYFTFILEGKRKSLGACGFFAGGGGYNKAQFTGDSVLLVYVGCGGEYAGFFLKGSTADGTYQLNGETTAWFMSGSTTYLTSSFYTGSLTIARGSLQRANGTINTLKGSFSFRAVDTTTAKVIEVKKGKFLLERLHY